MAEAIGAFVVAVAVVSAIAAFGAIIFLSWRDCHLAEEAAKEAERDLNKWRYIHAVTVRPKKKRCCHD